MKPRRHKAQLTAFVVLGMLAPSAANAEIQLKNPNLHAPARNGPLPQIQLKPDLVVHSMGFSAEFCWEECGNWARELQVFRAKWESCAYRVLVKNVGAGPSVPGQVRVEYTAINGPQRMTAPMPALRAGEQREVLLRFNNSRMRNTYFSFNHPFRATVDSTNTNAESNEANNTVQVTHR